MEVLDCMLANVAIDVIDLRIVQKVQIRGGFDYATNTTRGELTSKNYTENDVQHAFQNCTLHCTQIQNSMVLICISCALAPLVWFSCTNIVSSNDIQC